MDVQSSSIVQVATCIHSDAWVLWPNRLSDSRDCMFGGSTAQLDFVLYGHPHIKVLHQCQPFLSQNDYFWCASWFPIMTFVYLFELVLMVPAIYMGIILVQYYQTQKNQASVGVASQNTTDVVIIQPTGTNTTPRQMGQTP